MRRSVASGRWWELPLFEQMANIGSEVERALSWRKKNEDNYSQHAFERALELLELTLSDPKHRHRLKEFARLREMLCDYFAGENEYHSTADFWQKYFYAFNYALRKNH